MKKQKIHSVLIANRGEIARRICRTLKKLNINAVAVYSDADAASAVLQEADDAVWIGEAESKESYLNIDAIIAAAKSSDANAIHPGYGFLSENPQFAAACKKAGLIFIGPSPETIATVADKRKAKDIARALNIPTTESLELQSLAPAQIKQFAEQQGLPLLIKAAFGGGGRGMRIIRSVDEIAQLANSASDEAAKFFSSSEIFIETLVEDARHIEVQILGSEDGNVIALGTRDCSWQRHYQKVIEEAPAAGLADGVEAKLLQAATDIGKAVKYTGAGTVEFLVKEKEFYFLEVNSRLQVEHPVTEMIYKVDLVEAQIRIASGEPLVSIFPTPPQAEGHAIEARVCAENTRLSFAPQTGYCPHVFFPDQLPSAETRFDFAFDHDGEISHFYDSMIGKAIVWAPSKHQALEALVTQLRQLKVIGTVTNTEFLLCLLQDQRFRQSTVTTNSLATLPPAATPGFHDHTLLAAATIWLNLPSTVSVHSSFRILGTTPQTITGFINSQQISCSVNWHSISSTVVKADIEGRDFELQKTAKDCYTINGSEVSFHRFGTAIFAFDNFGSFCIELPSPKPISDQEDLSTLTELKSSLPGKVISISVTPGQSIAAGDILLTIESMKMEHQIKSPRNGIIDALLVKNAQVIAKGTPLVTFTG